jgi:glycosyltransferase involved in cell wall biosynthesis
MMKILYITLENLSLHKGSVVHIKEIVNGLREAGHQVGLVAISSEQPENADHFYNLNLMTFSMPKLFRLKNQPHLVSSILLFLYLLKILPRYDIIYARDFHTVIIALLPRIFFNKRLIFEINGIAHEEQKLKSHSILNRIFVSFIRKGEEMATKYSERIISVTPHIGIYLIENYKCAPDKVITIGNGVNTKYFYPIRDEALLEQLRKKVGIAKEEIIIVFVGNLAPWQGVETLIEVAPLLLREIRNIRFLIIGDGILKKPFEEKVNRLGVSDHFVFTGMVIHKEIPLYINIADICVLPKRRLKSGYSPIKLYEYMACGKPVVASRVEGLEFIEEEGTGRLTEPEDIISLEKTLYNLIKEPQERLRMGGKGFQIARERFSWESKVTQIEEVLKKMA